MNVYSIGDLHLSFSVGPDKSMDRFGGVWINHAQRLKDNWEKTVADDDLVIMPGDFSWALKLSEVGPDFDYLKTLPGKKLMVRGNHDLWWSSLKKMRERFPEVDFIQNDAKDYGSFAVIGSRGWISPDDPDFKEDTDRVIFERERIRLELSYQSLGGKQFERLVCAVHFPPQAFSDLFKKFGVTHVVYGHLHGDNAFKTGPEGLIDGIEYRLVSLDKLNAQPQLLFKA